MTELGQGQETGGTPHAVCDAEAGWHLKIEGGQKKNHSDRLGRLCQLQLSGPLYHSSAPPCSASFSCCQVIERVLLSSSEFLDSEALSAASARVTKHGATPTASERSKEARRMDSNRRSYLPRFV